MAEDPSATAIHLNGTRLHGGAHLLAHGDRIDLGTMAIWFAAAAAPRRIEYDAERDGADRFCARTKARLAAGEAVVACPGTPQQSCSELYRAVAWRDDLLCRGCGFDPKAPEFEPTAPPREPARVRLLELSRLRAARTPPSVTTESPCSDELASEGGDA